MNTSKKLASFVLGAGFSHALAKQKLTDDFSCQLLDYEIHIFDLNFDLVLEATLVNSELRKEFNDFFPDSTYYPSEDELLKKTYYSKPFNKSLLEKINLYKLHGAFNIFHVADHLANTHQIITKPHKGDYYNYPAGFKKLRITSEHYKFFLNEPTFEAIEKINPTTMEMSNSLWIGNTYKVSMIGMGQTYPSFCHTKFREILPESDSVFIIGYGTKDHDINSVLSSCSKLHPNHGYFFPNTEQGIKTSVTSSITELNCKIDKRINFDCYLNQCLAQKL